MQACPVLLHYNAGDNVFERFVEFGQLVQTLLNHVGVPLIHFIVNVRTPTDSVFNRFFDNI